MCQWNTVREQALNLRKTEHTIGIIRKTYINTNIFFLQEVAAQFIETIKVDPELNRFSVLAPAKLGSRDQNSVILLDRSSFDVSTVMEISPRVEAQFVGRSVPVAAGDILAVTVNDFKGVQYMLVSFHGDTNGLATIAVTDAVNAVHSEL